MATTSFATQQQLLRKITGLIVAQKRDKGESERCLITVPELNYTKLIDDDVFATVTSVAFDRLYDRAVRELGLRLTNINRQPAQAYIARLDIQHILSHFQQTLFESEVLQNAPASMRCLFDAYEEAKRIPVDQIERDYLMVDALHAIFLHLRRNPGDIEDKFRPADEETPLTEFFVSREGSSISCEGVVSMAPVLEQILGQMGRSYKVEQRESGPVYHTNKFDIFSVIGSRRMQIDVNDVPIKRIDKQLKEERSAEAGPQAPIAMAENRELMEYLIAKTISLFNRQDERQMSAEDKAFRLCGGAQEVLSEMSHASMRGLGIRCGTGPLEECIVRLAGFVNQRTGRPMSECLSFAAGRICRMNSNKNIRSKDGTYYVSDC